MFFGILKKKVTIFCGKITIHTFVVQITTTYFPKRYSVCCLVSVPYVSIGISFIPLTQLHIWRERPWPL